MKHPETYDLFPTLVQKYNITNDSTILDDIFSPKGSLNNVEPHNLLANAKRSVDANILDSYTKLKSSIQEAVDLYSQKIGICRVAISQSWYNIADNGGFITRHTHPGSVISGAYYPFIENNYGGFVVENPNPHEVWNKLTKYNETAHDFEIKTDDLLLFPSRMNHFTEPNQSGTRLCISFNTRYVD